MCTEDHRRLVGFIPMAAVLAAISLASTAPGPLATFAAVATPLALSAWAVCRLCADDPPHPYPPSAALTLATAAAAVVVLVRVVPVFPSAVVVLAVVLPALVRSILALLGDVQITPLDALPSLGIALLGSLLLVMTVPMALVAPKVEWWTVIGGIAWVVLAWVTAVSCLREQGPRRHGGTDLHRDAAVRHEA